MVADRLVTMSACSGDDFCRVSLENNDTDDTHNIAVGKHVLVNLLSSAVFA